MLRIIITAVIVISTLFVTGCSDISDLTQGLTEQSTQPGFEIIKEAQITPAWKVSQIRITIGAGEEFDTLLRLADDDRVDGFFYLEKSDNVSFEIRGTSAIYQSVDSADEQAGINSDRFSFTASQRQGNTYTLTFRNTVTETEPKKVTVFLEVIYPATGAVFFPAEAWKS